jgi:uncharacterized damage-inducible protein DinB
MSRTVLKDAFGHHVWATLRLIDACAQLTTEQLETPAPGTYGSIMETMRHIVGADSYYLSVLTEGLIPAIDEDRMDLAELRATLTVNEAAWFGVVARDLDPEAMLVRRRHDGSDTGAPVGIRLAQALHHGTDHRSQICTVLTTLGMEPPDIDVWAFAEQDGRLIEVPPSSL